MHHLHFPPNFIFSLITISALWHDHLNWDQAMSMALLQIAREEGWERTPPYLFYDTLFPSPLPLLEYMPLLIFINSSSSSSSIFLFILFKNSSFSSKRESFSKAKSSSSLSLKSLLQNLAILDSYTSH